MVRVSRRRACCNVCVIEPNTTWLRNAVGDPPDVPLVPATSVKILSCDMGGSELHVIAGDGSTPLISRNTRVSPYIACACAEIWGFRPLASENTTLPSVTV